jgi:hypothetical protein
MRKVSSSMLSLGVLSLGVLSFGAVRWRTCEICCHFSARQAHRFALHLAMPNNLARFAINADDVSRARRFL